jgi:hypothetical protein
VDEDASNCEILRSHSDEDENVALLSFDAV